MDVLTLESHAKDLLIYLNELFIGKSLCDVHVRSADGVYFPAHKIIIASSSIHIYQMVMSTPEASQLNLNVHSHVLHILSEFIYTGKLMVQRHLWIDLQNAYVHSHVLHVLLEFIYTGKLMVQRHLWIDLQNAATLLQMYNLLDLMKRFEAGEVVTTTQSSSQQCLYPDGADKHPKMEPKSTVEIGTMTDDLTQNGEKEKEETPEVNTAALIKKEKKELKVKKDLELCYYDPKGGPISRLRPLVRPNFKKMHEEIESWTFIMQKKTGKTRSRSKSAKAAVAKAHAAALKRKPKKKRKKYAKRLNKFGKEMRYRCHYCRQSFRLLFKRHKHMCRCHMRRYYTKLYASYALKKIMRVRSGTRMNRKKTLRQHLGTDMCNTQTGPRKIHYCRLCHMRFFKHSLFMFHFSRVHAAKFKVSWFHYVASRATRVPNKKTRLKRDYPCSRCHKAFVSEDTLAMHYERYHPDPNDRYQQTLLAKLKEKRADNSCKICGKSYHFRSSLSRHMIHHKQEKPHQCATCGKIFSLKAGLKEHAVVHEADKMCICAVCGKSYKHRQSLRRHMVEHDPDRKEFVCTFCGKVFFRNEKFLKHLKAHESQHGGGNTVSNTINNTMNNLTNLNNLQNTLPNNLQNNLQSSLQNTLQNSLQNNLQANLPTNLQPVGTPFTFLTF